MLEEEVDHIGTNVGLVIQLVTTGGFGALVWYLIARHIPAQNKDAREDAAAARTTYLHEVTDARVAFTTTLAADRAVFMAALEKNEESHREELTEMRSVTMQLVDLVQRAQAKA